MSDSDDNFDNAIMPFGKYRDDCFKDIPVEYLDWLIGQNWVRPELVNKITQHLELSRRSEWEALSD